MKKWTRICRDSINLISSFHATKTSRMDEAQQQSDREGVKVCTSSLLSKTTMTTVRYVNAVTAILPDRTLQ